MPDIEVKTKTYNDMQNNRKNTDPNSKDVPSEMLCKMEPIIKLFSAVTNTGSATEIPEAYQRQIENNKQLTELSQDFQKQLEEKKATHLKLQTSLEQAKFQQTEQSVNAEKKLNSIATSVDDIELQRLTQTSESHGIISLIESVKQGIASLAEKVNATHVEGRATEHNVNRLSLEKQMELITEKMEAMKAAMKTSIGSCSLNSGSWNPEEDPLEYLIKLSKGIQPFCLYFIESNERSFVPGLSSSQSPIRLCENGHGTNERSLFATKYLRCVWICSTVAK